MAVSAMSSTQRLLAVVAAGLLVASCANGSASDRSAATAPVPHQLDEHANGTTVDAQLGDTIVVTLHSTYWAFDTPSRVLQPLSTQPSPSHCAVVGSGCGTVTVTFNAAQVGTVTLHAHRDSCGEAMRCVGNSADWSATVRVS
jgi:hypothetical protein